MFINHSQARAFALSGLVFLGCLSLLPAPVLADLDTPILLNEVLYDPPGADGGWEFVELVSRLDRPQSLAGLRLEFCNGAEPGAWTLLWAAAADESLAAGGLYLLGESEVPGAQAHVSLGMQNGPDALRLLRGETLLDLLGYGEGLDGSLCEAWPAADAAGKSLARRPDGIDTDQNALDWFVAEPTPGDWNFPDFRAKLLGAATSFPPLRAFAEFPLRVWAENRGAAPWPEGLQLSVDGQIAALLPETLPGHRCEVEILLPGLPPGAFTLQLALALSAAAPADSLQFEGRVGVGDLLLSELLFAPDGGEPEWVECYAREPMVPTAVYQLADLSGTSAAFSPPALPAGETFLLCADALALLARHPGIPAERILELSPWPSLANGGESEAAPGWTDGLRLDDAEGRRSDGLLYRGDWIPARGISLERVYLHPSAGVSPWSPCPRGSSPLVFAPPGGAPGPPPLLQLQPNPFDPDRERLSVRVSEEARRLRLEFFDASGRSVQRLETTGGAGLTRLLWDGRDAGGQALPDGAYPLLLELEDAAGRLHRLRSVCALQRRGQ